MTYNFTKAKEQFPLSVELLMKKLRGVAVDHDGYIIKAYGIFDPLNLQFFFDDQGVQGCTYPMNYSGDLIEYDFDIYDIKFQHNNMFATREQAYVALFDKCFEILEKRLQESKQ